RTGLILTGTGTAGAYHAGALRALHEAGVKIDIVGAHGIGTIGALFAAVDGAQRLWDEKGFWRSEAVRRLYRWQAMLRVGFAALAIGWINRGPRRQRGPFWWRLAPVPLSSAAAVAQCWRVMWDLLRGAAALKPPSPSELSRRYLELATENLGQPGFREIVVAV